MFSIVWQSGVHVHMLPHTVDTTDCKCKHSGTNDNNIFMRNFATRKMGGLKAKIKKKMHDLNSHTTGINQKT